MLRFIFMAFAFCNWLTAITKIILREIFQPRKTPQSKEFSEFQQSLSHPQKPSTTETIITMKKLSTIFRWLLRRPKKNFFILFQFAYIKSTEKGKKRRKAIYAMKDIFSFLFRTKRFMKDENFAFFP